ncbi:MAG: DUF493 domain-containing protein [Arenicellales bacterium]
MTTVPRKTNGGGEPSGGPYDSLEFPCRFEIKVMGRPSNRFSARVAAIFTRHLDEREDLLQVLEKYSRRGRYVSVTYIIRARRKEQLRAIYLELSRCDMVLMTL